MLCVSVKILHMSTLCALNQIRIATLPRSSNICRKTGKHILWIARQ